MTVTVRVRRVLVTLNPANVSFETAWDIRKSDLHDRPMTVHGRPVCDDAFLLKPAAKIHSQISASQLTSDLDVIGRTVSG
jgi:hypothetical protein